MVLRPYQNEAIEKINESFAEFNKVLLVMATGLGKTVVFNSLASKLVSGDKKVLVLAHRDELISQAAEKMSRFHDIDFTIIKSGYETDMTKNYFVGSVQSLCKDDRLNKFPKDYFSLIICDEAHHVLADTYQKIFNYFEGTKVLGVTATPSKTGQKKLSSFFETTAFEYNLEDAIRDKWCADIIYRTANINIDLSNVKTVAGDFSVGDLDEAIQKELNSVSNFIKNNLKFRKSILIFTPLISSAKAMSLVLNENGLNAEFVCGESKNRKEILEKFSNGKINILVNSMLVSEGVDIPPIDCIINLRPTQSITLAKQQIGRGTRLCPGKSNLLVIDMMWNSDKDIINPCDFFANTESVSRAMKNYLIINMNKSYDLFSLEKYISYTIGTISKMEDARLIAKKDMETKKPVNYKTIAFLLDSAELLEYDPVYQWEVAPITENQNGMLLKNGILCDNLNKGLACKIICLIVNRMKEKKCSIKQMLYFARRAGIIDNVKEITFDQAAKEMEWSSSHNWTIRWDFVKKYAGSKKINTSLINLGDLKIDEVKEGVYECLTNPF